MSTVPVPQPRSPSNTREQLDELDALLQRMLELPVDPTGGDGERPDDVPRAPAVSVTEAPPPPEPAAPPSAAVASAPAPTLPAVARALEAPPPRPPDAPSLPVSWTETPPQPNPPRPAKAAPPWVGALVQVNRVFDRVTRPLGTPGSWLRGPRGRALLGWTGLLLLATALALSLLGWSGWF
jgi:hypothetical protein